MGYAKYLFSEEYQSLQEIVKENEINYGKYVELVLIEGKYKDQSGKI